MVSGTQESKFVGHTRRVFQQISLVFFRARRVFRVKAESLVVPKLRFSKLFQFDCHIHPRRQKFIFHFSEIYAYIPASRPQEGRCARHSVGAGCDGRVGVAGRAARMRTAKVRGPDLPMLGSSLRVTSPQATVAIKARTPGRARHKLSTHHAGNAGWSGCTCSG